MIFSISGSQGQGKSTVLKTLQDNYDFNVIPNKTSRDILRDWNMTLEAVNDNKDVTVRFQKEIIERHYAACVNAANGPEIFLIERSFADIFNYAMFILGPFNRYDKWLNEYYDQCREYQKLFSSVFIITGRDYTPLDDGVRSVNKHYMRAVDILLPNTLASMSETPYKVIKSPSNEDRAIQIQSCILQLRSRNS